MARSPQAQRTGGGSRRCRSEPRSAASRLLVLVAVAATSVLGLAPTASAATPAGISTVAGGGTPGFSGGGGPAPAAGIDRPVALAVLPGGGFLFVESFGNRVRRVAPDGTITTVAGTGEAGLSGDGGLATAAKLNRPFGVAAMPDGGFLIAD